MATTPTNKRSADSNQCCPSKKARVGGAPQSSGSAGGSKDDWPTVFSGNEVVWLDPAHNWMTDVKTVILGREDGETSCSFKMGRNRQVQVYFATQIHSVEVGGVVLPTTTSTQPNFSLRVHLLVDQCCLLRPRGPCHLITQFVRAATTSEPDSDDEQIADVEIPPAFSNDELVALNAFYPYLWCSFQNAKKKQFQNAMGNFFFVEFGKFLLRVHPQDSQQCFISTCSTNPTGEGQPGNFVIVLTDECRNTRQNTSKQHHTFQKRVADYTLYDNRNKMYAIVGEIKSDHSDAESQNIEQMVGLFRKNQQAMLGFTCNSEAFIPRILIQQQGVLSLHILQSLSLDDEACFTTVGEIAKLFIAFTSIVNIAI